MEYITVASWRIDERTELVLEVDKDRLEQMVADREAKPYRAAIMKWKAHYTILSEGRSPEETMVLAYKNLPNDFDIF